MGGTTGGGDQHKETEGPRWSALKALVWSAGVSIGVLAATVGLLILLASSDTTGGNTEAALSLVFVAATVVLVLVVSALAIVLRRLGLTDGTQAMGLPAGSIRAVIALLLIMLFFIAAVFIFNRSQNTFEEGDLRTIEGVSVEQYAAIPTTDLKSATERTVDDAVVYDVVLYPPSKNTETSDDLAKQLVTTVGTLVTAVAAFYFGTATAGKRGKREDGESEPATAPSAPGSGDGSGDGPGDEPQPGEEPRPAPPAKPTPRARPAARAPRRTRLTGESDEKA